MRRTALAVAALLAAASPALAAGAYITRTVQDGSGPHLQSYYDESGTGAGPFDPVFQVPSGTNLGGQSGGAAAADQTGTNATDGQATSTNNQHTLAFGYGWNGSAWDRLYVDATTHGILERTVGPSMNAPGTSGTIARSIQGVTGGLPVPVSQSNAPWGITSGTAPGNAPAGSYNNPFLMGFLDGGGLMRAASASNPLPVSERGSSDPSVAIVPNAGTGSTCTTTAATTGCIVSTAANNLYRAYATAPTAPSAQQYLVCINASAVPAANAAFPAGADFAPFNLATTMGSTASINFGPGPPSGHPSGTTCVISTSLTTYVAGTASIINAGVR